MGSRPSLSTNNNACHLRGEAMALMRLASSSLLSSLRPSTLPPHRGPCSPSAAHRREGADTTSCFTSPAAFPRRPCTCGRVAASFHPPTRVRPNTAASPSAADSTAHPESGPGPSAVPSARLTIAAGARSARTAVASSAHQPRSSRTIQGHCVMSVASALAAALARLARAARRDLPPWVKAARAARRASSGPSSPPPPRPGPLKNSSITPLAAAASCSRRCSFTRQSATLTSQPRPLTSSSCSPAYTEVPSSSTRSAARSARSASARHTARRRGLCVAASSRRAPAMSPQGPANRPTSPRRIASETAGSVHRWWRRVLKPCRASRRAAPVTAAAENQSAPIGIPPLSAHNRGRTSGKRPVTRAARST
eukprot:Hpha_TRINITY_DN27965_c0_g1::TRINITY_DN27965_c0_g1_i1::g.45007::m.45007